MPAVVFDTNVLLDLFVFNDIRALHLKAELLNQKLDALATPNTLEEFTDVLARPVFSLTKAQQEQITLQWFSLARRLNDSELVKSPWTCQDPDDQVFLDLAYSSRPCYLFSKDNEILRFANTAAKDQVFITADYKTPVL